MEHSGFRQIDMGRYARSEHFKYFNSLDNPYVGVTCNVDITDFLAAVKKNEYSFFLAFLWCAARSANAIAEFRQRVYEGGIVEFDNCPTSHTVARNDGTYCYCRLDCRRPLDAFMPYSREEQRRSLSGGIAEDADAALPLFFVSTLPWLSYTALVQPTPRPADSNPRITTGKYFRDATRVLLPVSVLCNHALVDGIHIARFYQNLDETLGLVRSGIAP